MTNTKPKLLADLLPPKIREAVYAVLIAANAGYLAWEIAADAPVGIPIAVAVINASGFTLARSNTK